MRLLVTGGAGYVGSIVSGHLVAAGHDVVVLDNLSTGHRDAVVPGAEFIEGDILDADKVITPEAAFDGVLHFAARSLVGESMSDPAPYWDNNVVGTRSLLNAMRAVAVPRIVFSSTAAVYGEPDSVPIEETAQTRPTSTYGASKLAVDLMLTDEARAYGVGAASLRYFNVAGAWRGLGERHPTETHLIPIALQVASGDRTEVTVFGEDYPTPDGTGIRDYIHVADLAVAHLLALEALLPGEHAIYNLGSGAGFSVREVLDTVREVTGHRVPARHGDRRAGDPAVLIASSEKIRAALGWVPTRTTMHQMVTDAWQVRTRGGDRR